MALSFQAVEIAYKVMHELGVKHISSFPDDIDYLSDYDQKNPKENYLFGYDKKQDGGWESLFFLIKNPSSEFIAKWDALKSMVPNTSMNKPYKLNDKYTLFGWF